MRSFPLGRPARVDTRDRQTGKTAIAIDTILNQRGRMSCVSIAPSVSARPLSRRLWQPCGKGAMDYTVVVVTEGTTARSYVHLLTPRQASRSPSWKLVGMCSSFTTTLPIMRAYRELSLLLRRPLVAKRFRRYLLYPLAAARTCDALAQGLGGGSLTALPIIETEAQDISAYIPTNLISITDGQIYLSPTLFELAHCPRSMSKISFARRR